MRFLRGKRPLGPCIFSALQHGNTPEDGPVNFSNWKPTDEETEDGSWPLSAHAVYAEIGDHCGNLTRDFVRRTFSAACDDRAIIWTLVWGYPKGRIQMSRANMKSALASAERVADAVAAMRAGTPIAANDVLHHIHRVSKGIKTSTSSKIAYFAGLTAKEGQCLILDEKVIASILYNRFDQLRPLVRRLLPRPPAEYRCLGEQIADAKKRQAQVYGDYIHHLNQLADKQGLSPDSLEAFLFANAPSRKTAEAYNKEWKQIRDKHE